jgi:NarL family two-component system response regulator LiaR
MSNPIRIMLVDDHSQVHRALSILQDTNTDLALVAHASNGNEAFQLCQEQQPDVIIMDVVMPVMNGIDATRIIHEQYPVIKILALSSFQDDDSVHAMIKAGAVGYILKNSSLADLANAIRVAFSGASVLSAEVMQVLFAPKPGTNKPNEEFGLTERELEILAYMVKGFNNKQIAHQLVVSEPTVKFHVRNILAKLKASGRTEAVAIAVDKHLIG